MSSGKHLAPEYKLNKETILKALEGLSDYFKEHGAQGEICIFGGTAMLLAFDAREMTRDVDAIFQPSELFCDAAKKMSKTHHLPEHWLNDGVKGFVSSVADFTREGLPQFSHLRIMRPTAQYLLAMKCLAARDSGYGTDGDKKDVMALITHLQLQTAEEIFKIIENYYPQERIGVKTKFFIEEIIQEVSQK
jgi:hypothetical protein